MDSWISLLKQTARMLANLTALTVLTVLTNSSILSHQSTPTLHITLMGLSCIHRRSERLVMFSLWLLTYYATNEEINATHGLLIHRLLLPPSNMLEKVVM